MLRKHFILAVALAPVLGFGAAQAATEANYDPASFAAAQQADKPILVDISASWCPTCARQRPIIETLAADPAFENLMIFKVDFDAQKDVVKTMGAQVQSTLIVFHGAAEKGRSTGDTNAESIRGLLAKAES
jgi:thioredoxin 1